MAREFINLSHKSQYKKNMYNVHSTMNIHNTCMRKSRENDSFNDTIIYLLAKKYSVRNEDVLRKLNFVTVF